MPPACCRSFLSFLSLSLSLASLYYLSHSLFPSKLVRVCAQTISLFLCLCFSASLPVVCLSPSVFLFARPYAFPCAHLPVYMYLYLMASVCLCLSLSFSVSLPFCMPYICPTACLSACSLKCLTPHPSIRSHPSYHTIRLLCSNRPMFVLSVEIT